jgi:hypothetical protein
VDGRLNDHRALLDAARRAPPVALALALRANDRAPLMVRDQ